VCGEPNFSGNETRFCKRTQFSSLVLKYILEEGGGVKDIYIPNLFSRNLKVFLPNFFCTHNFLEVPLPVCTSEQGGLPFSSSSNPSRRARLPFQPQYAALRGPCGRGRLRRKNASRFCAHAGLHEARQTRFARHALSLRVALRGVAASTVLACSPTETHPTSRHGRWR